MKKIFILYFSVLLFSVCVTNPLTGKRTMAFVDNSSLFPQSFAQYQDIIKDSKVVKNTPEAEMVTRLGTKMAAAAQKWLEREGYTNYLDSYMWEYNLVQEDTVNAWCMPGGKIVVYTGLLPITKTEEGLAVVMGHEIAHALLNHGQQRLSAGILQELGATGVAILTSGMSETLQSLSSLVYSAGSSVLGVLPFSRANESEADHYGLILMAIAGYNPDEAVPLWERMSAGESGIEFLSTHPSGTTRIKQLRNWNAEAKQYAASFGVRF